MKHTVEHLIIGAGPAGIAMAGRFSKAGMPYRLIEKSERPGDTWRNHYDRLHLHTTRKLSALPHMPFPASYPKYIPKDLFVTYLESYVAEMNIEANCGETITDIRRVGDRWLCETDQGVSYDAATVIVATGFNRIPNEPQWPGMEVFEGPIHHSRLYKSGKAFKGQNVLVIGMGNTGAELAIDLHEQGARPFISIRGPVNFVQRDLKLTGGSTQETAILLAKLPNWLGDWIATQVGKLTVGDLRRYGIERPAIPPSRQLRELGKTPVIDVGTLDLLRKGLITVVPAVQRFESDAFIGTDGNRYHIDAVILATGYHARVEAFIADVSGILNPFQVPRDLAFPDTHPNLYFLGFNGYAVGGLLRAITRDSRRILEMIRSGKQ